jgi:hypothetical protein
MIEIDAVETLRKHWLLAKKEKVGKKKEKRTALWKSGKRKKRVSHFPTGPATSNPEPTRENTNQKGGRPDGRHHSTYGPDRP